MFVCSPSQALVRRSDLHQRCSQAIGSSIRIASALTMPTESNQKVPDPGLTPVAGDHITMDSESRYRERERDYRQSEQYALMQRLYPQLRLWMSRCQQSDLVSDSLLDWERSHGDL